MEVKKFEVCGRHEEMHSVSSQHEDIGVVRRDIFLSFDSFFSLINAQQVNDNIH